MNILTRWIDKRVQAELKRFERERAEDNELNRALYQSMGMGQGVFEPISTDYIQDGYNKNSTLYSIVSWIARNAARIQLCVVDQDGEAVEFADVDEIIECPNPDEGKSEFFEKFYSFKLTTGNSYIYTPTMENGKFTEMYVMPADDVEIVFGSVMEPIKGYRVKNWWTSNQIDSEKVLHNRYTNLTYGQGQELYGMSPVKAAIDTLRKSNSNFEALYKSYENLGAAGFVVDKSADPALRMDPVDVQRGQEQLDTRLGGADKANKPILTSLQLEWIPFNMSPVDLALHADQDATLREFCRVYNVASELFGDKSASTYDNMAQAVKWSLTQGVLPHVESFVSEFNRQYMPKFDERLRLAYKTDDIQELQGDELKRVQVLKEKVWMTTNEKREVDGLEPKEGGDEPLVSAAEVPLSMVGQVRMPQPPVKMLFPDSVKENAKKALEQELTPTFEYTANQIINDKPISEEKLLRMKNYLAGAQEHDGNYLAYGGKEMLEFLNENK